MLRFTRSINRQPVASVIAIEHGDVVAVGGDELLAEFDRAEKQIWKDA
jgi:predicted amidohydrolase YtcJ